MHFARNHNPHRRLHLLHGANLHRRSVRAQQQPVALRLRFLAGDKQRVLGIARGMVRRKIQCFEIIVVGLDHRTFLDRVAEIAEDGDDLVHGLDHGMLGAERAANAGQGDVEGGCNRSDCVCLLPRLDGSDLTRNLPAKFVPGKSDSLNLLCDSSLDLIDPLPHVALGIFRGRFQPEIVDLGEDAILAADPAVAEGFPVSLGCDTLGFFFQRGEELLGSFVKRSRREAF